MVAIARGEPRSTRVIPAMRPVLVRASSVVRERWVAATLTGALRAVRLRYPMFRTPCAGPRSAGSQLLPAVGRAGQVRRPCQHGIVDRVAVCMPAAFAGGDRIGIVEVELHRDHWLLLRGTAGGIARCPARFTQRLSHCSLARPGSGYIRRRWPGWYR